MRDVRLSETQTAISNMRTHDSLYLAQLDRIDREASELEEMFIEASVSGRDVDGMYSEKYPNVVQQYDPRLADNGYDFDNEDGIRLQRDIEIQRQREVEQQRQWELAHPELA